MILSAADFGTYFRAVHGHEPFGWQQRLLAEVLDAGWGRPIDLPTASGKTAVLDVAVFAMAVQAKSIERKTPRRVALVVDRRVVVDDAFRRASRIQHAVLSAGDANGQPSPVLAAVRDALLSLGGDLPLDCAALRGGIHREDRWARTPLQPVILCSTVDQVGSRLLHRGYGLSNNAWPIHAGLLGHDTLIVLDEAHCSVPFMQTLSAVARYRDVAAERVPGPWAFVPMTATPAAGGAPPFRLTPQERAEPVIARRLRASKPARLLMARSKGDEGVAHAILGELTAQGGQLAGPGLTTLVVVNRVRAARLLFDELKRRSREGARSRDAFSCVPLLLTGRSRAIERDVVLAEHSARLMAGRDRNVAAGRPAMIVVATQCIEVGADLDADALVTEACPMDSLRQRFGRLDRLGERGSSPALIVCRPEHAELPPKVPDPVYGDRLGRTWQWLTGRAASGVVDCGVSALDVLTPPMADLAAPSAAAPPVFPAYCDLWVQTGPMPAVSPDPAIFLHGPSAGPPEVGFVWRADLEGVDDGDMVSVVAAVPPVSGEVMPLPLHQARAWLAGRPADPGTDIEGDADYEVEAGAGAVPARHFCGVRWLGPDASEVIRAPDQLRPGDTLVLPCSLGGADRFGWTGRTADRPADLAEAGRVAARRPALLRVHHGPGAAMWGQTAPPGWAEWASMRRDSEEGTPDDLELASNVSALLPAWRDVAIEPVLRELLGALIADGPRIRVSPHPSGAGLLVAGRRRLGVDARDFADEDDLSSLAAVGTVTLSLHLADVRDWAWRIASTAGLPTRLVEALARAGHLHDLGKVDPRFQAWLLGGDRLRVDRQRPLAKSDRIRTGAMAQYARRMSGYPAGGRHELLSVRMIESQPELLPEDPVLRDLVLHLVASHHGRCRPWAPVVHDTRPITVRHEFQGLVLSASSATGMEHLASGVVERFWRLVRHFGWWGLSYLEACLRLADHRASETPGIEEEVPSTP